MMTMKPMPRPTIHPDDLALFNEVRAAMWAVARHYKLNLRSVTPHPKPEAPTCLGDCDSHGNVRLVLRFTVKDQWTEPRRVEDVWKTAAHELAHLRHFNHSPAFQEFEEEMLVAMNNRKEDHTQKLITKLVKMQKAKEGEAKLGNMEAAEAFARAINRLMLDYELAPSALDYATSKDNDPVIELKVDLEVYQIKSVKTRVAWQENLARVVANAHLCKFLIRTGTNEVWFVGTKSHATVAEYIYGTLVPMVTVMSKREYVNYEYKMRHAGEGWRAKGYRKAWLVAFVSRIEERFKEAREAAVSEAPAGTEVSLMRLNGALQKVREYIDGKYGKKRKYADALRGQRGANSDGAQHGRAAADRIPLGRKGIEGAKPALTN
jgi:hypothetical protein